MSDAEQVARMHELAGWVSWLVRTFHLESQVGACWYRHSDIVEHLTALYLGWVRTYALPGEGKVPERVGEMDWLARFHALLPHLTTRACVRGHEDRVVAPWDYSEQAMRQSVAETRATRRRAPIQMRPVHPAQVEMVRYQAQLSAALASRKAGQGTSLGLDPAGTRAKRTVREETDTPPPEQQDLLQDPAQMAQVHEKTLGTGL